MINWKLRLKNKATLTAIISAAVVFFFQVSLALGVQLPVSEEHAMAAVTSILTIAAALGIIVDPTTAGIDDSERAMNYNEPAGR